MCVERERPLNWLDRDWMVIFKGCVVFENKFGWCNKEMNKEMVTQDA